MAVTPQQLVAEAKAQIKEIDPAAAAQSIQAGAVVIDVREPAEYEAGKLPHAVNIPRGLLEFKIADHPSLADKDAHIVLYCKTGGRSALATLSLQHLGYSNVHSMSGGIESWIGNGQTVEK
ncbi:MAG: rhodanese-like domain-containing protein [Sulfuriferula sp.]